MQLEFLVNQPGTQGECSLAEIAWSEGDIQATLADLPAGGAARSSTPFTALAARALRAAYGRLGGILNLFTPPWGEKQDFAWHSLRSAWKAQSFHDENARRVARVEAEQ